MDVQGHGGPNKLMAPKMKVLFRADASIKIGIGHVMRCLTLADALKSQGAECQFICREHSGNLIEHLRQKGYLVHALPPEPSLEMTLMTKDDPQTESELTHSDWLGATQSEDAAECRVAVEEFQPDWLIVDHYALDARWEKALKKHYRKLMVIDDLADRSHICDLLLDQTYGRETQAYQPWVSENCAVFCGSKYALLRPEFAALRPYSLGRRENPQLDHLLITMGGIDNDNATGHVLHALKTCDLPANCHITVVMGASAPWLTDVRQVAKELPWPTEVRVNVTDMARLMADSDLAIGAAGSTSWERCCLGLPVVMLVLAENQKTAAMLLEQAHAVLSISVDIDLPLNLQKIIERIKSEKMLLNTLSARSNQITDGTGCQLVVSKLQG